MIDKATVNLGEAVYIGMDRILKRDVPDPDRFFGTWETFLSSARLKRPRTEPWFSGSTNDHTAAAFDPGI